MRLPRFPKAAASALGVTSRILLTALILYPGLVLSACAEPSLIEPPPTPALRHNTMNHDKLVQYLSNFQKVLERPKTSLEGLVRALREALQLEQDEQRRDRDLLAQAEAQTPKSMDASLKNEWDTTLTTLRHEIDDRRARSSKNEEAEKQLIADMEDLAHQYGLLSEQVGEAHAQLNAVPPSDALWLERRDVIKTTVGQLEERGKPLIKQAKVLSDHYAKRKTDWERTRSDAVVTARVTELEGIIGRARQLAVEQERQQALQRQEEEERQRRNAAEQARRAQDAQQQKAEAAAQASFSAFLRKHGATDMSSLNDSHKLYVNPFAYQGKRVFLSGGYHKNIDRQEAIVAILPDRDPTTYIVVWRTSRNLADGSPLVRCVVKVLGTTSVRQGMREREVPHVQEIECLR